MLATRGKYFIKYYPQHMILLSLLLSICFGTLLLSLPWASNVSMSIMDLFFTATSLTTVTGMLMVGPRASSVYSQTAPAIGSIVTQPTTQQPITANADFIANSALTGVAILVLGALAAFVGGRVGTVKPTITSDGIGVLH